MKFFLETADAAEIRRALEMGLCDGVTLGRDAVARAGRPAADLLREIAALVDGPVSAGVAATDLAGMLAEARALARVAPNVVVRVPLVADGLRAVRALTDDGIRTGAAPCFSAGQALLAAKAGATFVAPAVGALDELSDDGMALVAQVLEIQRSYEFATQVVVASVRHPLHVVQAARLGADAASIPFPILDQLVQHPLSGAGIAAAAGARDKIPKGP